MKHNSTQQVSEVIDAVKAQQQINLLKYKRALARRNFLKNVGLAGAGASRPERLSKVAPVTASCTQPVPHPMKF
jgi:hypothetical protein